MIFTDKEVLRWIEQLKTPEVRELLEECTENDRDGQSDIQIFADEVSYGISCFEEEGCMMCDDLEESRELIRVTKNGKEFPWDYFGFSLEHPMRSNDIREIEWELDCARETVAQYRQLCYRMKKLNERGIHGYWEKR